jgi:hypothetical protein
VDHSVSPTTAFVVELDCEVFVRVVLGEVATQRMVGVEFLVRIDTESDDGANEFRALMRQGRPATIRRTRSGRLGEERGLITSGLTTNVCGERQGNKLVPLWLSAIPLDRRDHARS